MLQCEIRFIRTAISMAFCTVINLCNVEDEENWVKDPDHMYIGRGTDVLPPSKWGNPCKIKDPDDPDEREMAIKKYEHHLRNTQDLYKDIINLKGKTLACHCAPLPCHGEVI